MPGIGQPRAPSGQTTDDADTGTIADSEMPRCEARSETATVTRGANAGSIFDGDPLVVVWSDCSMVLPTVGTVLVVDDGAGSILVVMCASVEVVGSDVDMVVGASVEPAVSGESGVS